jgi:glycerophosphoryl diester phosphodiesterase
VPLLIVLGVTAWFLLTDYDINFYLKEKPPAFWLALSITVAALVLYVGLVGRKLLHWSLAVPLVLFSELPSTQALEESARLTTGKIPHLLRAYVTCLGIAMMIGLIPHLLFDLVGGWIVSVPYDHLAPLVLMLGSLILAWLAVNFFTVALGMAGFAVVTAQLYGSLGPAIAEKQLQSAFDSRYRLSAGWGLGRVLIGVALVAAGAIYAGSRLVDNIRLQDTVQVIAHRGAAGAAPENTLAAVRQAIADGADWVEIDVQESRDGQVVVFHDSDFMKLSGNPAKLWEGDLKEIQTHDIGSWFDAKFAAERVPTLEQVLQETKGRVRLMIELKYYGHDQQLEQRVVDLVEAADMAGEVSIMSLKLAGVQKMQALRPNWTVGLLAATSVGDLSKVDVDFLAVSARMGSTQFIKRAHAAGKRVLVWTVNDALSLSKWMSMGVDGVITDEPALARSVLRERAQMSSAERLLVSAALFLGKPVPTNEYRDSSP